MVGLYCVSMCKWILMNIFMRHIFWSTWNAKVIAQSPDHNKKKWRPDCRWWPRVDGRCWEKKSVFHGDLIDCNWVCTSEAGRNGCKYNYWRRYGFTEQSEHWAVELRWSDLGRRWDERCLESVTPRMRVPKCRRVCKQRHCCDSQKISVFRCE